MSRTKRMMQFAHSPLEMAPRLLGQRLVRIESGRRLSGLIVEVEAYLGARDPAAHTFDGHRSPRNESMYLEGGHAYVYFIYGVHHCLNVVCGRRDEGVAVLVRALQPEEGVEQMFANRPAARSETDLCSGPGKLAQAMHIDRALDGLDLRTSDVLFIETVRNGPVCDRVVATGPRVGLGKANPWRDRPYRFALRGNVNVSRPRPAGWALELAAT